MRILLCNWRDTMHPAHGGAEVYTREVLRRWADAGHAVTMFSAAVDGRPSAEHLDGVEHVRGGSRLGVYRAARRWWQRTGRHRGFDVVIDECNTRPFGCHRWPDVPPVVALIHQLAREVWFDEMTLPVAVAGRYLLEPKWLRSLRYVPVLTVSPSSRSSLLDAGLQRVVLVPEGIDGDAASGQPKYETPTALFVGRLSANKRPDHAVTAVELARRRFPDLRIKVLGGGDLGSRLAAAGDHVECSGRVPDDVRDAIVARCHVQLVTSVREGWGLVVDEAARLGTPTIGYDVPGLRDSVPAAGGLLVPPRPEAMAEALISHLPELVGAPVRNGWLGGARSWDDVAATVLDAVIDQTRPLLPGLDSSLGTSLDLRAESAEPAAHAPAPQAARRRETTT